MMIRIRTPAVIVGTLLALTLVACGQTSLTDEQHFQSGMEKHEAGEFRAAVIEYKNALQMNPDHLGARLQLAEVSLELGDPLTARQELNRAERLGGDPALLVPLVARADLAEGEYGRALEGLDASRPAGEETAATAEVSVLRGEALMGLGRVEEARAAFAMALGVEPRLPAAHLGMATVQIREQRPDEARSSLRAALENDPAFHRAWDLLGDLERSEGDLDAADEAYGHAIAHAPVPNAIHLKRGLTRISSGDLESARTDLQALRRLAANQAGTAYLEGVVHYQEARYPEAQAALEMALSRAPGFEPAVFFLGASHSAQGNWTQAEHHLRRYMNAYPSSADAARLLAQVRLREGDPEGAASLLQPVLGRNPDDVFALNLLGNIFIARGDVGEGIGYLRRMAIAQPEDASVRAALASGLLRAGEQDEGLRELERAVEQAPGEIRLEVSLIVALLQNKEYDAALQALELLDERMPEDSMAPNLRAAAYIGKQDFARARESLQEALRRDPADVPAASNLAQLAARTGSPDEAAEVYRRALERNPGHPRLTLGLAQLEAGRGNTDEMRRLLEASIERYPDELGPRIVLARVFLGRNEAGPALSVLETARSTHGENAQFLDTLAVAQIAAGNHSQAITTLRALTEVAPSSAAAHYRLGRAFEQAGSPRDARTQYRRALEFDAAHADSLGALANIEFGEGRVEEALALAGRLQKIEGSESRGYAIGGEILAITGRPQEAAESFQRAYSLAPSGALAVALAQVEQSLGEGGTAAARLEGWLEDHPDDHAVRFHLAGLRLALGQAEAATTAYETLVNVNPRNVVVLNNLAYLYHTEGDSRALEMAERAHALAPERPEVADTLGWILLNEGEIDRALGLLERARSELPDRPEVRFHFANALVQAGQTDRARSELTALLEDFPDFPERSRTRALLENLR